MGKVLLELASLRVAEADLEGVKAGAVVEVRLDAPQRLNALSVGALTDLVDAFEFLQRHGRKSGLKVVVLVGAGRALSAGADLKEHGRSVGVGHGVEAAMEEFQQWRAELQLGRRAMAAIEELEALTLCGTHGYALGGGWCLSLACDLTVSTSDCVFQMPEINLGIPLTWACTPRLVSRVGVAKAKEFIALGERVSAQELASLGAINRVVESRAAMDAELARLARVAASKSPLALHMVKTQFRAMQRMSMMGDITESDGDLLLIPAVAKQLGRGRTRGSKL